MIERLRHVLRRESLPSPAQPLRPNQLSQQAARPERLRREALRDEQIRRVPERSSEQLLERREPMATTLPPRRELESSPVKALTSRSTLRQAWLLMEILGPPRALRGRDVDNDKAIGGL